MNTSQKRKTGCTKCTHYWGKGIKTELCPLGHCCYYGKPIHKIKKCKIALVISKRR